MTGWERLLHRLGFHSVDRCAPLHTWEWNNGGWVARNPPAEGPPTEGMEPPRKLPPVTPPTRLIASQPPPGRHRPQGERIRPPRRDG